MGLDQKRRLDLRRDESHVVRLMSVGTPASWRGKPLRALGAIRAYHYVPAMRRGWDCSWANCKFCKAGRPRDVRFEVPLIWESPDGSLQNVVSFLNQTEHRLFGREAELIAHEGIDPSRVRLLWKWSASAPNHVSVIRL